MTSNIETKAPPSGARVAPGKYLAFTLAGESYGIAVLKVREIIKLISITQVPQMPPHVTGVVNLRGKIIPVVDLRIKFGMQISANTERTCIVVVQVTSALRTTTALGLVVDSVEEVVNILAGDTEETPDFGAAVDTSYLIGMAKIKGKVVSLLDIDRVVGAEAPAAA